MATKCSNREYFPLTSAQKTMLWPELFIMDKKRVSDISTMTFYFTVNDNPDPSALKRSFQKLIRDNDSFRIATERKGVSFRQYIYDYEDIVPEEITLSSCEEFTGYLKTLNQFFLPFCAKNHVWASIVCYEGKASLVMRIHHLCMDGYSLTLIFNQLSSYYDAYSCGREPSDHSVGKITDFFTWQKKYKHGIEYKNDFKYWANSFMHQRNYQFPVPRAPISGASNQHTIVLDSEVFRQVNDFCKLHGLSFIQLVMLVSGLVVYHLTKKDNFALCTMSHGRRTDALRRTIGCMMNIYPVFYDINSNDTMREYMKKASKQYFNSMMHSRFSHSDQMPLTYYEAIKNGFRFNPYWIVFSNIDYAVASEHSKYSFVNITRDVIPYQFYCSVYNYSERLEIKLNYRSRYYSKEKIRTIERDFRSTLEKMIISPNASIQ